METEGGPLQKVTYSKRSFAASFKADPEIWSTFKSECKMRGVHICCVLEALMLAWMEGQRAQSTVIKPVTVNMTLNHVVKRPRRKARPPKPWEISQGQRWPPNCDNASTFIESTKEVGCLEIKDWIPLEKCWRCFLARGGYV